MGILEASGCMELNIEVTQGLVKQGPGQVIGSCSTATLACQVETAG